MNTNLQLAKIKLEKAKQEFQLPENFNLKKFQELANVILDIEFVTVN